MIRTSSRLALLTAAVAALSAAAACSAADIVNNNFVFIDNNYHWQQTSFYCGPSSLQMMLDCAEVRDNNPQVVNLLTGPVPAGYTRDQWVQLQIYAASRSRNFLPIQGTDPVGFSLTANAYDGTANGGALPNGVAQGAGPHTYAWWGFLPTVVGADLASRTVANTLHDYKVPATVSVDHGAHWIDVRGVTARPGDVIGRNGNYKITGFFVRDPWTGYALTHPAPGQPLGLGTNAWYRYGFDSAAALGIVNRPGAWFNFFNPVGNLPAPYANQYVVEVEPIGPELPDDGNGGLYSSIPDFAPLLPTALTASTALSETTSDLSSFSELSQYFQNGTFDSADESLQSYPGDAPGVGDWLIPFDGPGGINDIRGAILMDSLTGEINQATWLDAGDPSMTLAQLNEMFYDEYNDILPIDDVVPEPAMLALLVPAVALLTRRRTT